MKMVERGERGEEEEEKEEGGSRLLSKLSLFGVA